MYFLIADEAQNQQSDETKFFIYGAIVFPAVKVGPLTLGLDEIRSAHGFLPTDSFKFSPNDKPKEVDTPDFIEAKKKVLKLCAAEKVSFIGYAMLHAIGANKTNEKVITWGADQILTKFQQYLVEQDNSRGIAFFDTLPIPHPNSYLRTAFQNRLEHAKQGHRLANIDVIASVTDGCSHLTSICDICTGSFRYVVNEPERDLAGKELAKLLKPLFWGEKTNQGRKVTERGLLLRPKSVTNPLYEADYEELKNRILKWSNKN